MANAITWSVIRKNTAASADIANTSPVVISVSRRVGHVTLATSDRTSRTNCAGSSLATSANLDFPHTTNGRHTAGMLPPRCNLGRPAAPTETAPDGLAGAEGLEPPTSGFGDRRSSQLSYAPGPRRCPAYG